MMVNTGKRSLDAALLGFFVGAVVPLFWGVLTMLAFNVKEGWLSEAFWGAVYVTCPFWRIEGEKSLILTPLLNGMMYAVLGLLFAAIFSRFNTPSHGQD